MNSKYDLNELIDTIIKESDLSIPVKYHLKKIKKKNTILIAFGKGAISMANGAIEILDNKIQGGVIVIPKGSKRPKLNSLEIIESSHPIPDQNSIKAGEAVIEWSKASSTKESVIFLVSGGGSALVEKPLEGITLDDIIELNKTLLNSGLNISEINTIRKHVSQIKGGRLAEYAYPSNIYGFYASDVPGDSIDQIASGPTVPDPTTFEDALKIINNNNLKDVIPKNIIKILYEGVKGSIKDTPKPGDIKLKKANNKIIATNEKILKAVSAKLKKKGYKTIILTSRLEGESREVGYALASITLDVINKNIPVKPPLALILGGETSVTVKGNGKGGRNLELALAWGIKINYWQIPKEKNASLLAFATDGIDGPTDCAGAIISSQDLDRIKELGVNAVKELNNNNSYYVLDRINALIKTGQTGSNLNNIIVIAIN
ncbi:MAG: glycerate kinase [Caldisphaera sp.]|nr:glycerate kinase [Caldisphaera sp.]